MFAVFCYRVVDVAGAGHRKSLRLMKSMQIICVSKKSTPMMASAPKGSCVSWNTQGPKGRPPTLKRSGAEG